MNQDKQQPNSFLPPLQSFLDLASSIFQMMSKFGAAAGVLVVFIYFSKIGFFPKDMNISDGLIFVFAVLAFAFVITVGTLYGGFSILWIFQIIDSIQERRVRRWQENGRVLAKRPKGGRLPSGMRSWSLSALSFLVFVIFFLAFCKIAISKPDQFNGIFAFATGFLLPGFLALLSVMRPLFDEDEQKIYKGRHALRIVALISIALFPFLFGSSERLLATTMKIAGLRHENVIVELSPDNHSRLASVMKALGKDITFCQLGNGHVLIPKADILWNGIGTRALLRVTGGKPDDRLVLELDAAGIWVLRTDSHIESSCNGNGS